MNNFLNPWNTNGFTGTWFNQFPVNNTNPIGYSNCGSFPGVYNTNTTNSWGSPFFGGFYPQNITSTFPYGQYTFGQFPTAQIPSPWFGSPTNGFTTPFYGSPSWNSFCGINPTSAYTPWTSQLNNTWGFNTLPAYNTGFGPLFTGNVPFNPAFNGFVPGYNQYTTGVQNFTPSTYNTIPSFNNAIPFGGVDSIYGNTFGYGCNQNVTTPGQVSMVNGIGYPAGIGGIPQNFYNTFAGSPWFNAGVFGVPTNGFTNVTGSSNYTGITASPFGGVPGYTPTPGFTPSFTNNPYQGVNGFNRPVNGACPTTSSMGVPTSTVGFAGQTICRDAA